MLAAHRATAGNRPLLWAGDYNEDRQGSLVTAAEAFHGQPIPGYVGQPTRWRGSETIDHLLSNRLDLVSKATILKTKISDHKPLMTQLTQTWSEETLRSTLTKQHTWETPPGHTSEAWQKHLDNVWLEQAQSTDRRSLATAIDQGENVDQTWTLFLTCVHQCFRVAAATVGQPTDTSMRTAFESWQSKASRAKAKLGETSLKQIARRQTRDPGTMQQRKATNWMHRAIRLQQLLSITTPQAAQERARLVAKLRLPRSIAYSHDNLQQYLQTQVDTTFQNIKQQQQQEQGERLQQWRTAMRQNRNSRRKWIDKANVCTNPTIVQNDQALTSHKAVLQAIREHWENIWAGPAEPNVREERKSFVLDLLPDSAPTRGRPSEQEFLAKRGKLKGSPGPDAWTVSELRMLPQAVAQTFIRITQQWEQTGRTPTVLQRTRQINLIKPGKIKNNTIEAKHLRPISVSSLWWRWWSSAWATSELLRDWRSQTLPGYILGGPGSEGCEQITHNCLQQFQQKGYLCSLDYSFAFDTIDPLTAAQAMGKIGLPEGLWRVLCHQWSNQSRLMQWSTSSSPEWLSTTISVPQGDPCSPLALNVFMWAGCRYVANQAPARGEDRAMAVYMDDRTWTASTPQVLLRTLRAWGEFSNRAGLKENAEKTQLCGFAAKHSKVLNDYVQNNHTDLVDAVVPTATVLGVSTIGGKRRRMTAKEEQRIAEATSVVRRIALLPTSARSKSADVQSMAVAKAAYGWIGRRPTQKACEGFNQAVNRITGSFKFASPHLRRVLQGGSLHLEAVVGVRQLLLWAKAAAAVPVQERPREWPGLPSPLEKQVKDFMKQHGWQSVRRRYGSFRHSALRAQLDIPQVWQSRDKKQWSHLARESFRHFHWLKHLASARRDVPELRGCNYHQQRMSVVRDLFYASSGSQKAVLLGSVFSPAAFAARPQAHADLQQCIWPGCQEKGTWRHICWECQARPAGAPCRPEDPLTARYGWPAVNSLDDREALMWMTKVTDELWTQRHSWQAPQHSDHSQQQQHTWWSARRKYAVGSQTSR